MDSLDVTEMRIVITGTFPTLKRAEAVEWIEAHGGIVQASVNKHTDMVIVGEKAGATKLRGAANLGIDQMDAIEFEDIINAG